MQSFDFGGNAVRVAFVGSEPWWVANDVCACLELGNARDAVARLDADDVGSTDIIDSLGRKQTVNTVSEAGLYSLILGSRKPEAKAFKRWVTHEVLPAIRRTGTYSLFPHSLKGLSASAARVYLLHHATGWALTASAVARELNSKLSSVAKWERELAELGIVERQQAKRGRTIKPTGGNSGQVQQGAISSVLHSSEGDGASEARAGRCACCAREGRICRVSREALESERVGC